MTTTLELAAEIALAVLREIHEYPLTGKSDTRQAVLDTLRKHHCWFCRVTENTHGDIVSSQQMELWP